MFVMSIGIIPVSVCAQYTAQQEKQISKEAKKEAKKLVSGV